MDALTDTTRQTLSKFPATTPLQQESLQRIHACLEGRFPDLHTRPLFKEAALTGDKTYWAYYWIETSLGYLRQNLPNQAKASLQELSHL